MSAGKPKKKARVSHEKLLKDVGGAIAKLRANTYADDNVLVRHSHTMCGCDQLLVLFVLGNHIEKVLSKKKPKKARR